MWRLAAEARLQLARAYSLISYCYCHIYYYFAFGEKLANTNSSQDGEENTQERQSRRSRVSASENKIRVSIAYTRGARQPAGHVHVVGLLEAGRKSAPDPHTDSSIMLYNALNVSIILHYKLIFVRDLPGILGGCTAARGNRTGSPSTECRVRDSVPRDRAKR